MTKEDIGFTAGFFLGEGNVTLRMNKDGQYTAEISVTQLDKAPLLKLQRLWGGDVSIFKTDGKPSVWKWRRSGAKASPCIEAILPIMKSCSTFNTERLEKYEEFWSIPWADWWARSRIAMWFKTCVENYRKACHAYLNACYAEKRNLRR